MPRYAAVDIGSNSIRVLAADVDPAGSVRPLFAERKVVRLGANVFRRGQMGSEEISAACQVLSQFAEQCRLLEVSTMRVVATAAVRDASNQQEFLEPAERVLGVPVEVISGLEEARLIHQGVQSYWPHPRQRIFIVDIGGGSTELILGENGHFVEAFSKPLGALRLTELFIKSDPPEPRELARMERYIEERIATPMRHFGPARASRLVATSATAAATVCSVNNIPRSRRDRADRLHATLPQLRTLYDKLSRSDLQGRSKIPGIGPRRAEIIVPGLAVLNLVTTALNLPRLYYSTAGVRDGVLADLIHGKAARERSQMTADQRRAVRILARRYNTLASHVRKVADLASMLFFEMRSLHELAPHYGRLLEAAAHLYNIGHFVNEARHHRHSMYLVANSDLPGFEDRERMVIANLCRYHRKSLPQASHEFWQGLSDEDRHAVALLAPLLRLAIALDQGQEQRVAKVTAQVSPAGVDLFIHAERDVDNEHWHAQRAIPVFNEIYRLPLSVKIKR